MEKPRMSMDSLREGAKKLNTVEVKESKAQSKASAAEDEESIAALEALYEKYDGDLDRIFEKLGANPTKAKKPHNRPKNAAEFAEKYYKGFYTIVEDDVADAKSHK